eukprot:scaffold272322_cov17-Tisochrysis_lutea.AAC.1
MAKPGPSNGLGRMQSGKELRARSAMLASLAGADHMGVKHGSHLCLLSCSAVSAAMRDDLLVIRDGSLTASCGRPAECRGRKCLHFQRAGPHLWRGCASGCGVYMHQNDAHYGYLYVRRRRHTLVIMLACRNGRLSVLSRGARQSVGSAWEEGNSSPATPPAAPPQHQLQQAPASHQQPLQQSQAPAEPVPDSYRSMGLWGEVVRDAQQQEAVQVKTVQQQQQQQNRSIPPWPTRDDSFMRGVPPSVPPSSADSPNDAHD